jgi:hypothetical protein
MQESAGGRAGSRDIARIRGYFRFDQHDMESHLPNSLHDLPYKRKSRGIVSAARKRRRPA